MISKDENNVKRSKKRQTIIKERSLKDDKKTINEKQENLKNTKENYSKNSLSNNATNNDNKENVKKENSNIFVNLKNHAFQGIKNAKNKVFDLFSSKKKKDTSSDADKNNG